MRGLSELLLKEVFDPSTESAKFQVYSNCIQPEGQMMKKDP